MELLRSRILLVITIILQSLLIACSKEEVGEENNDKNQGKVDKIEFATGTETSPVISTEGGSMSFTFNATAAWTATAVNTRADSWCTVNPTSGGPGVNTITITTKANTDPDERSASVTIKSSNTSQTIKVTQKQKDALTSWRDAKKNAPAKPKKQSVNKAGSMLKKSNETKTSAEAKIRCAGIPAEKKPTYNKK